MSNDIVRYNNGLNSVPLRKFTPIDMDLFWGICSKMKRKGTKEEIFTFKQIKELIDYNINARGDRFANDLIKMSKKIITLSFIYEDEKTYEQLNLFQKFKIDKVNETLLIKVSEEFEYILNSIGTNFTRFELENMTNLKSSYVKELYRQLMAHKNRRSKKGHWFVKIEDFRALLAIPESYRMRDIDKQIFAQAKKEFLNVNSTHPAILKTFEIKKIKAYKGNKIGSLQIYFEENIPSITLDNWLEK